jgi:amino acid transporter
MTGRVDAIAGKAEGQLVRRLGLWSSVGIVIGITIGSGIFRTPAGIATRVPDPLLMLGVWVLGGAVTLCGALSVAELAGSLPHSGGLYVFLREGWGRLSGFLFGWAELILIRASAVGAIASVFGEYFLRSIGIDPMVHPMAADYLSAGAIVFAAAVNILGVQFGALIAGLSTITKFGALSVMVVTAFLLGGASGASAANFTAPGAPVQAGLFGLALISVLWAYDGFADLSFASGEVKDPQRNLPRALIIGNLLILGIYLLANLAYLYVTPIERLARSPLIAADTMLALFGQAGVAIVSTVVMISTFGSLNGTMLASPRIFFAVADDGLFPAAIARVHPRYRTPYVAIALAAALGIALVLTQTFEQLTDTFVLAIWPFYLLGVAAIYRLRRARPDLPRPYRVVGYPVVPAIFILGAIYLLTNALVSDFLRTAMVFGIVLAGIPVYYLIAGRSRPS